MCKLFTAGGKLIDPFDFQPSDVSVRDIAQAQSNIARWGGNTLIHMPLAQHSVIVSQLVEGNAMTRLAALFHDAEEYLLGDMPSPLKKHAMMAPFRSLSKHVKAVIFDAIGITVYDAEAIRIADYKAMAWECRDLTTRPDLIQAADLPKKPLVPWSPSTAKIRFLQQYTRLSKAARAEADQTPEQFQYASAG